VRPTDIAIVSGYPREGSHNGCDDDHSSPRQIRREGAEAAHWLGCARSAPTAATCILAPISVADAFGFTIGGARRTSLSPGWFRLITNPPVAGRKGWADAASVRVGLDATRAGNGEGCRIGLAWPRARMLAATWSPRPPPRRIEGLLLPNLLVTAYLVIFFWSRPTMSALQRHPRSAARSRHRHGLRASELLRPRAPLR